MPSFGERILLLRRRQGLTQRELAKMAGLNSNTLARVERGEVKDLGGQSVAKLARALGCTTDYLLGMTDDTDEEDAA
jgi:transcriptional regulator with XRE-family HTH domain